jgi:branched-chain amino acid transport system substrate-binding protein
MNPLLPSTQHDLFDFDLATLQHLGGTEGMRAAVKRWRQRLPVVPIKGGMVHPTHVGTLIDEQALEVFEALSVGDLQTGFHRLDRLLKWIEQNDWHDPYDGKLWFLASKLATHFGDPRAQEFHTTGELQLDLYGEDSAIRKGLQALMLPVEDKAFVPPQRAAARGWRRIWSGILAMVVAVFAAIGWYGWTLWNQRLDPQNAIVMPERQQVFRSLASSQYDQAFNQATRWLQKTPDDGLVDLARSNATVLGRGLPHVKIGLSGPFNTKDAEMGKAIAQGVNLAIQTHNWGSCTTKPSSNAGGQEQKVVVEIQVDNNAPDQAHLAAQHFVNDPQVLAVIGPVNSASSLEAGKVYAAGRLVHLLPTATSDDLGKGDLYPYTFRIAPSNSQMASTLVDVLKARLEGRPLKVIYDTSENAEYSKGLATNVAALAGKRDLSVIGSEAVGYNFTTELTETTLAKLRDTRGVGLFVAAGYQGVATLAKALDPERYGIQLFTGDSAYSDELLRTGRQSVNGLVLLSFFHANLPQTNAAGSERLDQIQREKWSEFVKSFAACYRGGTPNARAALAYDATRTALDAIARNGYSAAKREDINTVLNDAFVGEGVTSPVSFSGGLIKNRPLVELLVSSKGLQVQQLWFPKILR